MIQIIFMLQCSSMAATSSGRRKCTLDEIDVDLHEVDSQLKDLEYLEENLAVGDEPGLAQEEETVIYEYDEQLCEYVRLPRVLPQLAPVPEPTAPATERDQKRQALFLDAWLGTHT